MKTIFAILLLLAASPCWAALVAHWPLKGNSPGDYVAARTGTRAVLLGGDTTAAKTTTGSGGLVTAAFNLNGSDDAIDISGSSLSFGSGVAWSISYWFRYDTTNNTLSAIFGESGNSNSRIRRGSDTEIDVLNASPFTVPSIGTGVWHHVLITRTAGNSLRLFFDGAESVTTAQSVSTTFAPTRIGQSNATFLDGSIAYVKVFNSDESANVASLYEEGLGAEIFRRSHGQYTWRVNGRHEFVPDSQLP